MTEKEREECPNCKSKNGLFRCSLGALNCADCMEYIPEDGEDTGTFADHLEEIKRD